MQHNVSLTGGQAVVASLRAHHIEVVFGIPGVHNLPIYDALYDEPGIRHVLARHEQGAGYMADGYARIAGRPGVALVITGPGVTNIATPLADAYADSLPLLVIATSLPGETGGRSWGRLHELKDQLGLARALVGWSHEVQRVAEIPEAIAEALRQMRTGRPRGAFLQIPLDVLEAQETMALPTLEEGEEPAVAPDEETVQAALELLRAARRPVIIAGAGVTAAGANHELLRLAELLQAPVLLGGKSHDVLPNDHPLVITTRGAPSRTLGPLLSRSDLALVVGSKLGMQRTTLPALERSRSGQADTGRLPLPEKLIHIDIDAGEIGRRYPASVALVGDARLALSALLAGLHEQLGQYEDRRQEVAAVRTALSQRAQQIYGEVMPWLEALRTALPREGIVVADMTMAGYAAAQAFPVYEPHSFIHASELCSIGTGLPLALGAQLAAPQRAVVALCGDGGFLQNVGELATAAQERIPVVTIVFNDASYTAVRNDQLQRFPGRSIATTLVPPDFVSLARAFHIEGQRVEAPDELAELLRTRLGLPPAEARPLLIEVPLTQR
ncbi:MAG: thiamine pyrophosphate-binding protein [Thermogemmatispora sp.]|uniref:thiamine pyrophosphate-binding protein n=1 Tax=Thermogemmatispora sp. TaxID=1968838 RepID=UPI0026314FA8|nr:thiamine pyrophosphate-binding protein [Thermogemmatispora sp.]MBX5458657.1 thiamine pyrophosphate-binding protein [Thermogemmatispora sp.]